MKKFRFKLQAVLTLRQRAEQVALASFGAAERVRLAAAERVAAAAMDLSAARHRYLHGLADGCPALRAAQSLAWCHELETRQHQADAALRQAEAAASRARQHWLHARQQREVVEKYEVGQRALYERAGLVVERKISDDWVGRRLEPEGGMLFNAEAQGREDAKGRR